jgi:murein DD-endopeptidase MepM/ murein hydrolase activator NlpD
MKKRIHDKATRTPGSAGPVEWVQENVTAIYAATKPTTSTNTPFPKGGLQNWGNAVRIRRPGGCSRYFHMQPGSVLVKAGDAVRRGQPIATSGNIGRTSGTTHSSGCLEPTT